MTTQIKHYNIMVFGSTEGFESKRAEITLYGPEGSIAALLHFHDEGMVFSSDTNEGGVIGMHLPTAMMQQVVDLLRNEKPVYVYFAREKGMLSTSQEPVGEGE